MTRTTPRDCSGSRPGSTRSLPRLSSNRFWRSVSNLLGDDLETPLPWMVIRAQGRLCGEINPRFPVKSTTLAGEAHLTMSMELRDLRGSCRGAVSTAQSSVSTNWQMIPQKRSRDLHKSHTEFPEASRAVPMTCQSSPWPRAKACAGQHERRIAREAVSGRGIEVHTRDASFSGSQTAIIQRPGVRHLQRELILSHLRGRKPNKRPKLNSGSLDQLGDKTTCPKNPSQPCRTPTALRRTRSTLIRRQGAPLCRPRKRGAKRHMCHKGERGRRTARTPGGFPRGHPPKTQAHLETNTPR